MYKQKKVGSKGPLMPMISICSIGLIMYSMSYAGNRIFAWGNLYYAIMLFLFATIAITIARYTSIEIEYIWFSDELVVRQYHNKHIDRYVVSKDIIIGMKNKNYSIGNCDKYDYKSNCCATLQGRINPTYIYFLDSSKNKIGKMIIEPSEQLLDMLKEATNEVLMEK